MTVDETDEAFANVYSTAVSIQNVAPQLPQRRLLVAVAAVATVGALTIDLLAYQSFLLLLGSFFVPLFGVLLADWLAAGRATPARRLRGPGGALGDDRRLDRGVRALPVAPPGRPVLVGRRDRRAAGLGIGATLPSFALSFVLAGAVALAGKRRSSSLESSRCAASR